MRHLKKHVSSELGYTYEELSEESFEEAIFDVTDEVANTCDMGEVRIAECKHRVGYVEPLPTRAAPTDDREL
jgi:hypothetical protein